MWNHHTPSQAEGEPADDPHNPADVPSPPYPTPSQAEGDRDDEVPETTDEPQEPGTSTGP